MKILSIQLFFFTALQASLMQNDLNLFFAVMAGLYQQFNIQQKPLTVKDLKELAESEK